jgi:hypothetical protein
MVTAKQARMEKMYEEQVTKQEHMWIVSAAYSVTTDTLKRLGSEQLLFDAENVLTIELGCFICEQPFADALLDVPCPGEPDGSPWQGR